jgi:hypothetical protein
MMADRPPKRYQSSLFFLYSGITIIEGRSSELLALLISDVIAVTWRRRNPFSGGGHCLASFVRDSQ